jgi:hypothetical protein
MANGDGGDPMPFKVIPPPPPRARQLISFIFAFLAAVAGFLDYSLAAGGLAALSLVAGLADFFQNRGIVYIPRSMVDSEGRLKGFNSKQL